jgi:ABC-type microcin C transport system permease subunit YejB
MDAYNDYTAIFLLLSPLCFFIVAVSFRLMDNSALLFLQKEILVDSSNVSLRAIEEQIENSADKKFKRQLKRALLYRKIHRICIILMIACLPVTVITYFTLF